MNSNYVNGFLAESTNEEFVDLVRIGGVLTRAPFSREVLWMQTTETVVGLFHNDVLVKVLCTYVDTYSYGSSRVLKGDMEHYEDYYGITRSSTLELRAVTKVLKTPYIELGSDIEYNRLRGSDRKPKLAAISSQWRREVFDSESQQTLYPALSPVIVASYITWSSFLSLEENLAGFDVIYSNHPSPVNKQGAEASQ